MQLYRLRVNLEKGTLQADVLQVQDDVLPITAEASEMTLESNETASSAPALTLLDIIPSGPESNNRPHARPLIILGFSSLVDGLQDSGQQATVLSHWELSPAHSGLHVSFDAISNDKASNGASDATVSKAKH